MWGDEGPDPTRRFPLVEWNVDDSEIISYCRSRGFDWGGLYDKRRGLHVSCWHCALQSRRSLVALHDEYPDLWNRLLELVALSPFPWPGRDLDRAHRFLADREDDLARLQPGSAARV